MTLCIRTFRATLRDSFNHRPIMGKQKYQNVNTALPQQHPQQSLALITDIKLMIEINLMSHVQSTNCTTCHYLPLLVKSLDQFVGCCQQRWGLCWRDTPLIVEDQTDREFYEESSNRLTMFFLFPPAAIPAIIKKGHGITNSSWAFDVAAHVKPQEESLDEHFNPPFWRYSHTKKKNMQYVIMS